MQVRGKVDAILSFISLAFETETLLRFHRNPLSNKSLKSDLLSLLVQRDPNQVPPGGML